MRSCYPDSFMGERNKKCNKNIAPGPSASVEGVALFDP